MLRSIRHIGAVTATGLLLAVAAFTSPLAAAHDSVIGGSPNNKEVVAEFPDTITLEFSGYVKDDFNTFAVSDANTKEVLFSGEPTVDARLVSLDVPPDINPGPGEYRVGFQITSSDGHATRGMTTFTVAGESSQQEDNADSSAPSKPEASASEPVEADSAVPWGLIVGAGLAVVLIAGAIIAAAGKRR
ncbi:copper resistance CopC family protein [Corynebacterium cystitidis]|uniref:copper resistance CopC family protein n=1 Tax=Corynebacterium cystitidis TaxID=35757 RepID=UPI00211E0589|nr:copper resistance protein CopC [Corynebacterium cystitidis]